MWPSPSLSFFRVNWMLSGLCFVAGTTRSPWWDPSPGIMWVLHPLTSTAPCSPLPCNFPPQFFLQLGVFNSRGDQQLCHFVKSSFSWMFGVQGRYLLVSFLHTQSSSLSNILEVLNSNFVLNRTSEGFVHFSVSTAWKCRHLLPYSACPPFLHPSHSLLVFQAGQHLRWPISMPSSQPRSHTCFTLEPIKLDRKQNHCSHWETSSFAFSDAFVCVCVQADKNSLLLRSATRFGFNAQSSCIKKPQIRVGFACGEKKVGVHWVQRALRGPFQSVLIQWYMIWHRWPSGL